VVYRINFAGLINVDAERLAAGYRKGRKERKERKIKNEFTHQN
jgi:hypothetical protein